MAPTHLCLVSFATIFLCVFSLSPLPTTFAATTILRKPLVPKAKVPLPKASKLVEKICNGDYIVKHRFCLKVLSNPEAAAAKKGNELTKVVMKMAVPNAQKTLNIITQMASHGLPKELGVLKSCMNDYTHAIRSFGMVPDEMVQDRITANYDIHFVSTDALHCDTAIAAAKIQLPQISAGNQLLRYYSSIVSELTN
ncbi:Pectinesterase inhibitor [Corchorus olitorius]|uniref:Pectinesterase inhibitor n=1 Tax=Corchorus olitorius TaxID=93759 RepID=A0A1R3GMJ5_9ROSI|nr:Pectinesterase inhibitor [Corchorus olitorius]